MSNARELAELAGSYGTGGFVGMKNRLINSDMRIDQRNAGASITANDNTFAVDRFRFSMTQSSKGTGQQTATAPDGFTNSLLFTSSAATSVGSGDEFAIVHPLEGFSMADFGWGAANAQAVTLSFWVRSSLTGTFGGSAQNASANRSYPFAYTINSANTWEYKTVAISGDVTGTWAKTNGLGMRLRFGLGVGSTYSGTAGSWAGANYLSATGATSVVGTNGATFYITGVQLEKGSTATSFDYRPYGTELALCQRYYYKSYAPSEVPGATGTQGIGRFLDATNNYGSIQFKYPVSMRATPAIVVYNPSTGATSSLRGDANNYAAAATQIGTESATVIANNVSIGQSVGITAQITASIEL